MPIIHVDLLTGHPPELKQTLAQKLTEVVVETLNVSPESVRVLLREVEPEHWFVGGRPMPGGRRRQVNHTMEFHSSAPATEVDIAGRLVDYTVEQGRRRS